MRSGGRARGFRTLGSWGPSAQHAARLPPRPAHDGRQRTESIWAAQGVIPLGYGGCLRKSGWLNVSHPGCTRDASPERFTWCVVLQTKEALERRRLERVEQDERMRKPWQQPPAPKKPILRKGAKSKPSQVCRASQAVTAPAADDGARGWSFKPCATCVTYRDAFFLPRSRRPHQLRTLCGSRSRRRSVRSCGRACRTSSASSGKQLWRPR